MFESPFPTVLAFWKWNSRWYKSHCLALLPEKPTLSRAIVPKFGVTVTGTSKVALFLGFQQVTLWYWCRGSGFLVFICHLSKGCGLSLGLKQLGHCCPFQGCLPFSHPLAAPLFAFYYWILPQTWGSLCCSSSPLWLCALHSLSSLFWKLLAHCALMPTWIWILVSILALSHLSLDIKSVWNPIYLYATLYAIGYFSISVKAVLVSGHSSIGTISGIASEFAPRRLHRLWNVWKETTETALCHFPRAKRSPVSLLLGMVELWPCFFASYHSCHQNECWIFSGHDWGLESW